MYHMRYHVKREGFALCFLSIYMRRAEDSDSVVRRLFIVAHTREPPSWQRPFDSAALRLAVTGGHLSWIWSDLPGQSCLALQAPSRLVVTHYDEHQPKSPDATLAHC